ncbi:MAG TPA: 50S ribosomal protein L10 [Thermoanaerobaculia bacterium]|nr:50S ribosomal protein L10 [Thermoanaerobaculia bacterium]HUM30999.1 50S ribosomal protein L10 [Thermoanaerobaculia bacterium]HXK69297.1 50S ribosomal protein L10 [Thermoanaerobaculia bacterium]
MLRAERVARTNILADKLKDQNNVFLLNFKGINVPDITQLRHDLRSVDAEYVVVKNRLMKRVIAESELEGLQSFLQGPTAIVIAKGDPVEPSKKLVEFAKTHPDFQFKAGSVEGKVVDAATLVELSKMPSKEVLVSKLLYILQSPLRRLVTALNTPVQNFVSVLHQVSEHK